MTECNCKYGKSLERQRYINTWSRSNGARDAMPAHEHDRNEQHKPTKKTDITVAKYNARASYSEVVSAWHEHQSIGEQIYG